MISSITNLSDLSKNKYMRLGARYVDFWKYKKGTIFPFNVQTIKVKNLVAFASAKTISKDSVDTVYQLIDLAIVEPNLGFPINLEDNVVGEIGSDKVYLEDADIVFSKLNSHIGYVFLVEDFKHDQFELIGSTEFFPLKVNKKLISPKLLKYLLLHEDFRRTAQFLRTGKSQSHPRLQREDLMNLNMPIIPKEKSEELLSEIENIEKQIKIRKEKVVSLQEIINQILNKYSIKKSSFERNTIKEMVPPLSFIGTNKSLRIGAQYNSFWKAEDGYLFNDLCESVDSVLLKWVMKPANKTIIKKDNGVLDIPRILIEFESVESLYGKISDYTNVVTEIGSDKIEFGNSDLLTNKLRPYLGYTILNDKEKELIGTTEFMPFDVNKNKAYPEYIRYLLLSTEYLEHSKVLSSGTEHPRINVTDILNLRVPLPNLETQEKIIIDIKEMEDENNKRISEIKALRKKIDTSINEVLKELSDMINV